MKKSTSVVIAVIVVIVVAVGGSLLFHDSSKTPASPATKSTTTPVNNAVLTTNTDASLGQYLADPSGKPLYTYGADTSGVSNCSGSCLASWPAYRPTASLANLPSGVSTIKRSDNGQTQYTYNGMPLYYFVSDSAGKVTGNGIQNFSVATPKAAAASTSPSSSSSSSSSNYPY